MMGISPTAKQEALFSYHVSLDRRVPPDHELRKLAGVLDLDFVSRAVKHTYGRSGHVSLDPRVIVKMMVLLFYYDIPSERELMDQIQVRLDFLWFLGLDLESPIPDHSVLSKARARWGESVFKKLFAQSVVQCVQAGLVDGRLLHTDSTIVEANAGKDSVVSTSPELVQALREAYQKLESKLEVLPSPSSPKPSQSKTEPAKDLPSMGTTPSAESVDPAAPALKLLEAPGESSTPAAPALEPAPSPVQVRVVPEEPRDQASEASASVPQNPEDQPASSKKLPLNSTRISITDPEAELARSKNGVTDLNYKDHRIVDDAHRVITAVIVTSSNVADGTQLPALVEQHQETTGLKLADVTLAGDHHYGTASNYLYCAAEGIRPHLGQASANLEERGKLPLSRFGYEAGEDRLRCPQGHYLLFSQNRPEENAKVYLIEDPAHCAQCPLRKGCTDSVRGRSIQRHVQAELVEAGQAEAKSPAGRKSRKRRQHVMEGSFADAANNHGSKRARWRGLWRQEIQSYLIAAVQNLRILLKKAGGGQGWRALALALGSNFAEVRAELLGRVFWAGLLGLHSPAPRWLPPIHPVRCAARCLMLPHV